MKKLFYTFILFLFCSLISFASPVCLELNVSSDGDNITEFVYIDNESHRVYFANDNEQARVLTFNENIIRFSKTYPAPNHKGWTMEAVYEINRYTGGCTIEYTRVATSFGEKFDSAFLGIPNKYVYSYSGTAKKVETATQKF